MYNCDICPQRSQRTSLPEQNPFKSSPSPPPTATHSVAIVPDVNFQYLKHVVIKFLCSREDEALQLIRAISTLLEFSPQEEEHVKNYLSYRVILIILITNAKIMSFSRCLGLALFLHLSLVIKIIVQLLHNAHARIIMTS